MPVNTKSKIFETSLNVLNEVTTQSLESNAVGWQFNGVDGGAFDVVITIEGTLEVVAATSANWIVLGTFNLAGTTTASGYLLIDNKGVNIRMRAKLTTITSGTPAIEVIGRPAVY